MTYPTSTPSEQGLDPTAVAALVAALEHDPAIEPHGLIVQRHGVRVAEGYWAPHSSERLRLVYSLSKSFTGTALGLQVGEGRLALDDLVEEHLGDLMEGADDRTRRMTVRNIASMSSGHDREMILEAIEADPSDPLRGFFQLPPDREPGSVFAYNQPPVLALATILQRRCGASLVDYLRPRLLDPIGIGEFRWRRNRDGMVPGYSGVHTTLDAVARLGQLYLDDGVWNGRPVLPEGWVAQASTAITPNPDGPTIDWQQGYGLQTWRSTHGYRGDGAYGQFMLMLPEYDAVVALFTASADLQRVLDLVWEHLLPAFGERGPATPSDMELGARLESLAIPTARERTGAAPYEPTTSAHISGGASGQRSLDRVAFDGHHLELHEGDETTRVRLNDSWSRDADGPIVATAARQHESVVVDLAFVETPHRLELTADLADATFSTRWATEPLGAGPGHRLTHLRAPAD